MLGPFVSPQVNAVLQVVIAVLLLVSIGIKQRRRYFLHGFTMLAGVILNLLSFVLIMFPSLLRMEIINIQPLHAISIMTIFHSALGLIVLILGIWLVAPWHLKSSPKECFKKKKLMRVTTTLWLIALLMGFILYYLLYAY
jgi:uncharacterized membrane protein YozB (DUF420 family)